MTDKQKRRVIAGVVLAAIIVLLLLLRCKAEQTPETTTAAQSTEQIADDLKKNANRSEAERLAAEVEKNRQAKAKPVAAGDGDGGAAVVAGAKAAASGGGGGGDGGGGAGAGGGGGGAGIMEFEGGSMGEPGGGTDGKDLPPAWVDKGAGDSPLRAFVPYRFAGAELKEVSSRKGGTSVFDGGYAYVNFWNPQQKSQGITIKVTDLGASAMGLFPFANLAIEITEAAAGTTANTGASAGASTPGTAAGSGSNTDPFGAAMAEVIASNKELGESMRKAAAEALFSDDGREYHKMYKRHGRVWNERFHRPSQSGEFRIMVGNRYLYEVTFNKYTPAQLIPILDQLPYAALEKFGIEHPVVLPPPPK